MCAGNPRRDTPSAQTKQRILRIRCLGAFLETSSLDPPPAALRLFPCAIEILSFQNFYEVLKTCSAGRKDFFDTLKSRSFKKERDFCAAAARMVRCRTGTFLLDVRDGAGFHPLGLSAVQTLSVHSTRTFGERSHKITRFLAAILRERRASKPTKI